MRQHSVAYPNPTTMPYELLQRWAFPYKDCREADRKYFLTQIARYSRSKHLHRVEFFRFLRHHCWLRNGRGQTIKYMHFSEKHQTVGFCMYFKNWAIQALGKIQEVVEQFDNQLK